MKRNSIFKMVAVFAALMCGSMSYAQESKFAYNVEHENGVVNTKMVFKYDADGYLSPRWKYDFTYDAQNRVMEKNVMQWDIYSWQWEKTYRYVYGYDGNTRSIEILRCVSARKDKWENAERYVYQVDDRNQLLASKNYKWDNEKADWILERQNISNNLFSSINQ